MPCCNLAVLVDSQIRSLKPSAFKLAAYIYIAAANEPSRTVTCSIASLAEAVDLSARTVQSNLKVLQAKRLIDMVSRGKNTTSIRIPEPEGAPCLDLTSRAIQLEKTSGPASITELVMEVTGGNAVDENLPELEYFLKLDEVTNADKEILRQSLEYLAVRKLHYTKEMLPVGVSRIAAGYDHAFNQWREAKAAKR